MFTKEEIKNMNYRELEKAFTKVLNSINLYYGEDKERMYENLGWIENRMRGFEI